MADGTAKSSPEGAETQPTTQEMDSETYEDILATFTVAGDSSGNENTTRPTTAPHPIPLQLPTDTTTEERQGK